MNGSRSILICVFLILFLDAVFCDDKLPSEELTTDDQDEKISNDISVKDNDESDCWMKLDASELFQPMQELEDEHSETLQTIQDGLDQRRFTDTMLEDMLTNRSIANREKTKEAYEQTKIPAGINLGGRCMLRLPDCILFFHRMKLRNDTHFLVNELQNDIQNMMLKAQLSLNDLHLQGAYERTMTGEDPSILYYAQSFGEIQILLKDAKYVMEGSYKVIKNGLVIEDIISKLKTQDIMLTYVGNNDTSAIYLRKDNVDHFLSRLKLDLDKWLKDYFNDYLIFKELDKYASTEQLERLEEYYQKKSAHLATYTDNTISKINKALQHIGANAIHVPEFTIKTLQGLTIKLHNGELRGLDTIYRRSTATTTSKRKEIRYVDAIVGISNLKVVYKYKVSSTKDSSQFSGNAIFSSPEITGHLGLGLLLQPEVVEIDMDSLQSLGLESLTLAGPADVLISNFKYILHHHIATIMSDALVYGIRMLRALPRCVPFIPGQLKKTKEIKNTLIQYLKHDPKSSETDVHQNLHYSIVSSSELKG